MKNKIIPILLFFLMTTIFAHADKVEIASVTAHYTHPVLNITEDSGNNNAIGQGMTESVLDPQALIETDSKGNIYGTFRLHMADQIESYKISVQKSGDSNFSSSGTTEMKRQGDSIDVRVKLPSKNSIIRIEATITAMGRAVIFYGAVGDTVEGNTDFIVSVNPNSNEQSINEEQQSQESNSIQEQQNVQQNTEQNTEESKQNTVNIAESNSNENVLPKANERTEDETEKPNYIEDEFHGLIMKGDERLGEDKEKVHTEEQEKIEEKVPYGQITTSAITSIFVVLGIISTMIFLSGVGVMFSFFVLRKSNDIREAELYDFKKKY